MGANLQVCPLLRQHERPRGRSPSGLALLIDRFDLPGIRHTPFERQRGRHGPFGRFGIGNPDDFRSAANRHAVRGRWNGALPAECDHGADLARWRESLQRRPPVDQQRGRGNRRDCRGRQCPSGTGADWPGFQPGNRRPFRVETGNWMAVRSPAPFPVFWPKCLQLSQEVICFCLIHPNGGLGV